MNTPNRKLSRYLLWIACSSASWLRIHSFQTPLARPRTGITQFVTTDDDLVTPISKSHRNIEDGPCSSVSLTNSIQETILVPRHYFGEDPCDSSNKKTFTYPTLLHNIHIRSVLTPTEAKKCLDLATHYAATTGCWNQPDFERHASYPTCDFAVEECEPLSEYLEEEVQFSERVFGLLSELYSVPAEALSFLDLFCANYQAKSYDDQSSVMDRLEMHRDGSLLSFVILLNSGNDFEGGGTYVDALRDVDDPSLPFLRKGVIRLERPGEATIHSGKLLHGADVVTKGRRTVLVGFVEVDETYMRQGVLTTACRDFGRMDVAIKRYERQKSKTGNGEKGWAMNSDHWLPDRSTPDGCSILRGFCPAFESVERRARPEFQRKIRLEAEDILLRSILLDENEREEGYDIYNGDITIL